MDDPLHLDLSLDASAKSDSLQLQLLHLLPGYSASSDIGPLSSRHKPQSRPSLSGRTAITIVFSRPLVALGGDFEQSFHGRQFRPFSLQPDVPGRWRFATTYIARFDPEGEWPADQKVVLTVDPQLHTPDGHALVDAAGKVPAAEALTFTFETPENSMSLRSVQSEKADELTGKRWQERHAKDGRAEVPPDGIVELSFRHNVNLDYVRKALGLFADDAHTSERISVAPCAGDDPSATELNCVRVDLSAATLHVGKSYSLRLAKDSVLHPLSGPIPHDLQVALCGLRPFTIPFVSNKVDSHKYNELRPRHHRYRLWLRHGLERPFDNATLAELLHSIDVSPSVSGGVTLVQLDKATLELRGHFEPSVRYTISVKSNAAVKDGFGLTLDASQVEFRTADRASYLVGLESTVVFVDTESGPSMAGLDFFAQLPLRDEQAKRIVVSNVASDTDAIETALIAATIDRDMRLDAVATIDSKTASGPLVGVDPAKALGSSGLALVSAFHRYGPRADFSKRAFFVSSTRLAAQVMQFHDETTVWVTDMLTNEPVANVTVDVYATCSLPHDRRKDAPKWGGRKGSKIKGRPIAHVAGGRTQSSGLLHLGVEDFADAAGDSYCRHIGGWLARHYVVLRTDEGRVTLAEAGRLIHAQKHSPRRNVKATLDTDRGLYKRGETISAKGYLRQSKDLALLPPESHKVTIEARWTSGPSGHIKPTRVTVEVSPDFGSYSAEIEVPSDAAHGPVHISAIQSGQHLTSKSVLVSDPRPPTVTLEATAPEPVYVLDSPQPPAIEVKTKSATGSPVPDAEVHLEWKLQGVKRHVAPVDEGANADHEHEASLRHPLEGTETLTTDLNGVGRFAFAKLFSASSFRGEVGAVRLEDGHSGTLEIKAKWTGPTREVLERTVTVRIVASHWLLETDLSASDPIPGFEFQARASLHRQLASGPSPPVDGVVVQFDLLPAEAAKELLASEPAASTQRRKGKRKMFVPTPPPNKDEPPVVDTAAVLHALRGPAHDRLLSLSVKSCRVRTSTSPASSADALHCLLTLPTANEFVLVASVISKSRADLEPKDDSPIVAVQRVGRSAASWKRNPLRAYEPIPLHLDTTTAQVGDVLHLTFVNPFHNSSLLVRWGSSMAGASARQQRHLAHLGDAGDAVNVDIPIGDECVGGCPIIAFFSAPKQGPVKLPVPVPISPLLDLTLPRSSQLNTKVKVADLNRRVDVTVEVAQEVQAPGSKAAATVTVREVGSGKPTPSEVALWAVDEANLELRPWALPNISAPFELEYAGESTGFVDLRYQHLASPEAYANAVEVLKRRLADNPFIEPEGFSVVPRSFQYSPVHEPDDVVDARFFSDLCSARGGGFRGNRRGFSGDSFRMEAMHMQRGRRFKGAAPMAEMMTVSAAMAAPEAEIVTLGDSPPRPAVAFSAGAANDEAAPMIPSMSELRANFESTAVFLGRALTDENGQARIEYNLPDNAGTFVVRALAVNKANQFGSAETKQVVRRDVTLQPATPRIVRVGDVFEAGVTVTSLKAGRVTVTIQYDANLRHSGMPDAVPAELPSASWPTAEEAAKYVDRPAALLLGQTSWGASHAEDFGRVITKQVEVPADKPTEVRFSFAAVSIADAATLRFGARLEGDSSAGASDGLEVRVDVLPVQESVFMSTSMDIVALPGTVRLWNESLALPSAEPGTGHLELSAGVGYYPTVRASAVCLTQAVRKPSRPTGPVASEVLATLAVHAMRRLYQRDNDDTELPAEPLHATFKRLADKYTDQRSDSLRSMPLGGPSWARTNFVDGHLTAFGLFVANELQATGALPETDGVISSVVGRWQGALVKELERQAADSKRHGRNLVDHFLLLKAHLLLGASRLHGPLLSLDALEKASKRFGVHSRALYAVLLVRRAKNGAGSPADARAQVDALRSMMRVQGRTAYVAQNDQGSAASTEAQAWALRAFVESRSADMLVAKIARFLQQENAGSATRGGGFGYYSRGPMQRVVASLALAHYDASKGSSAPDVSLGVFNGDNGLMSARFTSVNDALVTREVDWDALAVTEQATLKPLEFKTQGRGEVAVNAGIRFVPFDIPARPFYRGIQVERMIQRCTAAGVKPGTPIERAELGAELCVIVQITTPDDIRGLLVTDLLPGGLEAVDPHLAQGGPSVFAQPHLAGYAEFFPPWALPRVKTYVYRDRVIFYSPWVRAGTHTFSYRTTAVSRGHFLHPPTTAVSTSQEELRGASPAAILSISQVAE